MLAFNLGVFFRNLRGEEVTFAARTSECEVRFTGGVVTLQEQTDLTRHLSVTLGKGDLLLRIAFEETEEEGPEEADVAVRLLREEEGGKEALLFRTSFRFADVSLKPVSEGEDDQGDAPPEEPEPPQPA
jgi:hypothetical protein